MNNPIRYIDPDGREIVDATGKRITYDPKTGWTQNATNDVKIIYSALMETPTGREQWEKAYTSDSKIEMNIVEEKLYDNDGTTPALGTANTTTFNYEEAKYIARDIMIVKISIGNINESFDGKNKGLTLRQAIGATAGHEIEHATKENVDIKIKSLNIKGLITKQEREKEPEKISQRIRKESRNSNITPMQTIPSQVNNSKEFDPSRGGFY